MAKESKYRKDGKNTICTLSLSELESRNSKFIYINDFSTIPENLCNRLVLYSPSKQSNLGIKISKKISNYIDAVITDLKSELDLKNIYLFSAFKNKDNKNDISSTIKNAKGTFLICYLNQGVIESLYASIRNALAHGNIVRKGNYYYLYSVSSGDSLTTPEKDKKITFLLKIKNLKNLSSFYNVFLKYN